MNEERTMLFYELCAGNPEATAQEIRELFGFDNMEMLIIMKVSEKGYVQLLNEIWREQ